MKALWGTVLTLTGMLMHYKVAEAAVVGEVVPVFFRSFRDAFRSFGTFGWPLPFLGLVPFFLRLAAYGLIVLVVILLLRDRRSTPPVHREERVDPVMRTSTATPACTDDPGDGVREEVEAEDEIERLRDRVARLEERLSRLEGERPE